MSFFKRIFKHIDERPATQPELRFGRYTDSYKQTGNYQAWDQSVEYFEQQQYLDSFRAFLRYLRDEHEDNVHWKDEGNTIRFELYQGSRLITGMADAQHVKAEAKVARAKSLHVVYMRRLVEHNFNFSYCRYALDPENNICAVFDTFTLDGSPYKIYYALKELAVHADKQDDLLLDEFETLDPIASAPLKEISEEEKMAKYGFICREVEQAIRIMDDGRLDKDEYPGGIGYLLLYLIYKLDYLTQPQGYMMESLERMHRLYFTNDNRTTAQKNLALAKELKKLAERPAADFYKEMYRTSATFGITLPANHKQIADFIDSELPHMDWYVDHGHPEVALAVPGFIVGYCLFHYAPPKPVKEFLHLYFRITEPGFFSALGFPEQFYLLNSGTFDKKAIRQAIHRIADENRDRYHGLHPDVSGLEYKDLPAFARTYLRMLARMEVVKH